MNKPDRDTPSPFPPEWTPTEAEADAITRDALRHFRETGLGLPWEEVRAWMDARRTDPNAPCPTPRKLF